MRVDWLSASRSVLREAPASQIFPGRRVLQVLIGDFYERVPRLTNHLLLSISLLQVHGRPVDSQQWRTVALAEYQEANHIYSG